MRNVMNENFQNNINSKLYEEINQMYPYGQFPDKYTKKIKERNLNNPNIFEYHYNNNNYNFSKVETQKFNKENNNNNNSHTNTTTNNNNAFSDLSKILPLITSFKDKKNMDSSSIFNIILPMIAGNKSKEISTLMNLFTSNKTKEDTHKLRTDFPKSNFPPIDTFEKVE